MSEYSYLFKKTKFIYLWTSQILSQMTIFVMNFLLLVNLFEKTGSSIATSFLWISFSFPAILIGPFSSAIVDLVDKRKVLIWTNFLQSLVIFLYAFLNESSIFLVYILVFVYSFLNQFYLPAEAASVPELVKKEYLAQANGLFFITQQVMLIIGFGMAGILTNIFGFKNSILMSSFIAFAAFLSVLFLPAIKTEVKIFNKFEDVLYQIIDHFISGYKLIRKSKQILSPFLLLLGMQVALSIVMVNTPILAIDIFHISPKNAGHLLIVPAGLGALIGSVMIPRMLRNGVRKIKIINESIMFLILIFLLIIFLIPELIINRELFSFFSILLLGFCFVGIIIPSQTFLQEKTPSEYRGRVFGNYSFLLTIATILPILVSGTIIELFGIKLFLFLLDACFLSTFIFIKKRGKYFFALNSNKDYGK